MRFEGKNISITNMIKSNKGITLIALVITIVVLIMLAVISINIVLSENGILKRAEETKSEYEKSKMEEELSIQKMTDSIEIENAPYVTDGLILWLDATNSRSFSVKDVWHDLSGNSNDFYLYNSPTLTNNFVGFNGVNQYARTINKMDLSNYESVTIEVVFQTEDVNNVDMIYEHTMDWNANSGGLGLATHSDGMNPIPNMYHTNHNTENPRNYKKDINTDWSTHTNIHSRVQNNKGRLTYINSELMNFDDTNNYGTSTETWANGIFANDYMFIGSRGGKVSFLNGKIQGLRIYNRALDKEEITKNYNEDKKLLEIK